MIDETLDRATAAFIARANVKRAPGLDETAYDRALAASRFIESDALSIRSQCLNLLFWLARLSPAPLWRTNLEAQLDAAEHELMRALEQVQQTRAAVEASRQASIPQAAAE